MRALVYNKVSKGDKVDVDAFQKGIQHALKKLGKPSLTLKEQQHEILKAVVMMKRDVLVVLPTGFCKSLIYQSLGFIFDFLGSDSEYYTNAYLLRCMTRTKDNCIDFLY